MLRERASLFRRLSMATDASIEAAAFWGAVTLWNDALMAQEFPYVGEIVPVTERLSPFQASWLLLLVVPLTVSMFERQGVYLSSRLRSLATVVAGYGSGLLYALIMLVLMHDFFPRLEVDRTVSLLFLGLTFIGICIKEVSLYFLMRHSRRLGYNYRQVVIAGTGRQAEAVVKAIHGNPEWGLRILGFVTPDGAQVGQTIHGYQVLGRMSDLAEIIDHNVVDEVVSAMSGREFGLVEEIIRVCEEPGIRVHLWFDFFNPRIAKPHFHDQFGFQIVSFETTPQYEIQLLVKRGMDVVGAILLLVVLSPLIAVISVLIKLTSPGPLIFKQKRMGLNGRTFWMYKFRSMYTDAEELLGELRDENEMSGPVFKMKDDPRVTRVGRWIRKFSLDELPQLVNVLKGEMSLVGPRPPIYQEVEEYQRWQRRRLSMRPGITCIWQVSGRNEIDFAKWMELDLEYIDKWSLWLDVKLLLKTIPAVLLARGAR